MRHSFANGIFQVSNKNGNLTALRHDEPWDRDFTQDNLVYWMLVEVDDLKKQRDMLLDAIKELIASQQSEGRATGGFISQPATREHQRRVYLAWQAVHSAVEAVEEKYE